MVKTSIKDGNKKAEKTCLNSQLELLEEMVSQREVITIDYKWCDMLCYSKSFLKEMEKVFKYKDVISSDNNSTNNTRSEALPE